MKRALAYLVFYHAALGGALTWPFFASDINAVSNLALGVFMLLAAFGWIVIMGRTAEAALVGALAAYSYIVTWNMIVLPEYAWVFASLLAIASALLIAGVISVARMPRRESA